MFNGSHIQKKEMMNAGRKTLWMLAGALVLLVIQVVLTSSDSAENKEVQKPEVIAWWGTPGIPENPMFAGEEVPLSDPEVFERFDRELIVNQYRHSYTIRYIKLAARWFPVIEPILEKHGIPDDIKYLAVAESGLENLVSPAGATGVWQFMAPTARAYGLQVGGGIDERYHLEKSTEAACRYLKKSYERLGSWTLAAAAYNMGLERVENKLKRQKADSYYDLYLNKETSRYVFRILALKYVIQKPENFGYFLDAKEKYSRITYSTVKVDETIKDLADFAIEQGTNYKTLKYLNPWLRGSGLTVADGKSYEIKIPA